MPRNVLAPLLLAAGVWLLAGLGWALLLLGVAVWLGVPSEQRVRQAVRRGVDAAGAARLAVARAPRRTLAAGGLLAAVALVPAGVLVSYGVGGALIAAGGLLAGVSILLGWNV
jgi:hypothetical protein